MYNVPPENELQFLVGRELIQVCIDPCQVIVHFDNQTSISIESSFHLEFEPAPKSLLESGAQILRLLRTTITSVQVVNPNELVLVFDARWRLHIFEDDDPYESFHITSPEGTFVI
jgi:hypothetical protein